MAFTSHGHHIPDSSLEIGKPMMLVRCGGPRICAKCSRESEAARSVYDSAKQNDEIAVKHDAGTMFNVYAGLSLAGITGQVAIDAVTCMQNSGILFRERVRS